MSQIRIGVVDDHSILAQGLAEILNRNKRFNVAHFGNCSDDISVLIEKNTIDVMIVDLNMPGDSFAEIAKARASNENTRILVFTASTNTDHAVRALSAGAAGFVLKGSTAEELSDAIEAVSRGDIYITPSFGARVISALQARATEKHEAGRPQLSHREQQIAKLLLDGKQNREIAALLALSEKTVKGYMTNLMAKLNVRNRPQLAMAAQKLIADGGSQFSRSSR